jgi:hypothetical protein
MQQQLHQFQLAVEPLPNASYALTVLQRPFPSSRNGRTLVSIKMGSIDGLALSSAWDIVLDVLRSNHHKPAAIQHDKKKCLGLSEESGVRLALLFKAIAPLSNLDHIRTLQQAVWSMSDEEAYYWFSKCHGPNGRRGLRALRILCGGVD